LIDLSPRWRRLGGIAAAAEDVKDDRSARLAMAQALVKDLPATLPAWQAGVIDSLGAGDR
jgi:hypothetical protein